MTPRSHAIRVVPKSDERSSSIAQLAKLKGSSDKGYANGFRIPCLIIQKILVQQFGGTIGFILAHEAGILDTCPALYQTA